MKSHSCPIQLNRTPSPVLIYEIEQKVFTKSADIYKEPEIVVVCSRNRSHFGDLWNWSYHLNKLLLNYLDYLYLQVGQLNENRRGIAPLSMW